jgi:superfamily I DNA/RNA helicase
LAINKTKSALKDRLSGKSKGILGSLKSSKLENLSKTLGKDEAEIDSELDKAKRYITIKGKLLEWSRKSTDKLELTEAQIETLVDTFTNIKDYGESLEKFIENLNMPCQLLV